MRVLSDAGSIRLGGVGPLTPPGIASAGSELLAGMEIAVEQANANGGVAGRPLECGRRQRQATELRRRMRDPRTSH
jgi:ABC-type branched-subunit amino acid transport system substrate-binding protein